MTTVLQPSLLDDATTVRLGALSGRVRRTRLTRGAWVDVLPGWVSGADALFERLLPVVPWREERRQMYDRIVEVPRLLCFYDEADPLPDPALAQARDALSVHYAAELGEAFRTAGLCCYRDGRDSVAWHGDRIGRGARQDTMVAIVSLGAARPLLLRPARRRCEPALPGRSRRPAGDGRVVPADLGARRPQDRAPGGPADQRAAAPARRTLTGPRRPVGR